MSDRLDVLTLPLANGDRLIEASAGTGKTWTLSAIALRLLAEESVAIDRLLLCTFTEAATRELRLRLRARIRAAIQVLSGEASPETERVAGHWLATVEAPIQEVYRERLQTALGTFDRAALTTLHSLCLRLLQDLALETQVPADAKLEPDSGDTFLEAARDFWRSQVALGHTQLLRCLRVLHITPEELANLWNLRERAGDDPQVLPECEAAFGEQLERKVAHSCSDLARRFAELPPEVAASVLQEAGITPIPGTYEPAGADLPGLAEAIATVSSALRKQLPECVHTSAAEVSAGTKQAGLAFQHLWIREARNRIGRIRQKRRTLSFSDCVRLAASAARSGERAVVDALESRYDAILVDEFQDTDPEQWTLIRALAPPGRSRLFLVGDPKQAIYGFRGADINTYLKVREELRQDPQARIHTLDTCFRSTRAFVDACNAIFGTGRNALGSESIVYKRLNADKVGDRTGAAIRFRIVESDGNAGRDDLERSIVTDIVLEIVRKCRTESPSRFAVLTRTHNQSELFREAFNAAGVPIVSRGDVTVWETIEAVHLASLLAAMMDGDEGALRRFLIQPWCGVKPEHLNAVAGAPNFLKGWLEDFAACRDLWHKSGLSAALGELDARRSLRGRLLGLPGGDRILANLDHLTDLLEEHARQHRLGPAALLRWLAQARNRQPEDRDSAQLRLDRDEAAVQIMTLHASKGLEFDQVYLPFSWQTRPKNKAPCLVRRADTSSLLILDNTALAGVDAIPDSEEARLLYVGVTRAVTSCCLHLPAVTRSAGSALERLLLDAVPSTQPDSTPAAILKQLASGPWQGLVALEDADGWQHGREVPSYGAREVESSQVQPPLDLPVCPPPQAQTFSFTSLHASICHAQGSASHDPEEEPDNLEQDSAAEFGMHSLPAGAATGDTLHRLLEVVDFAEPTGNAGKVLSFLQGSGIDLRFGPALGEMIRTLAGLALPLGPGGVRLSELRPGQCRREVPFLIRAKRPDGRAFSEILSSCAPCPQLDFLGPALERLVHAVPTRFMAGAIDFIGCVRGRYHIIDWKSNRLGPGYHAYTRGNVNRAMQEAFYPLQAILYGIALHRHLKVRLAGYDPQLHLGGAHYVFLRGLEGPHPEESVWSLPYDVEMIDKLEALFDHE